MTATDSGEDKIELLSTWRQAIRVCHKAHVRSAAILQRRNRAFGIPVVILSTIAGTAAFATLESAPALWIKILVGLLSVLAAVLASLQTFLGYSELAERHKAASQRCGALRREIEEVLALNLLVNMSPRDQQRARV
jgi:fatty acid desaturase